MPDEKNDSADVKQQIKQLLDNAAVPFNWDDEDLLNNITMFRMDQNGKLITDENNNLIEEPLADALNRMAEKGGEAAVRSGLAKAMESGNFFLPHQPDEMPRSIGMTGEGDGSLQIFEGGKSRELPEPQPLGFFQALLNRWFGFFADEQKYYEDSMKAFENTKKNQNAFRWNFETKADNVRHRKQVETEEKVNQEKREAAEAVKNAAEMKEAEEKAARDKELLGKHAENSRRLADRADGILNRDRRIDELFGENAKAADLGEKYGVDPAALPKLSVPKSAKGDSFDRYDLAALGFGASVIASTIPGTQTNTLVNANRQKGMNDFGIAVGLTEKAFLGQADPQTKTFLSGAVADGRSLAAEAAAAYEKGDPGKIGKLVNGSIQMLDALLQTGSEKDFRSSEAGWTVQVSAVKRLMTLLDVNPSIAKAANLDKDLEKRARGWCMMSDSLDKAAKAQKAIAAADPHADARQNFSGMTSCEAMKAFCIAHRKWCGLCGRDFNNLPFHESDSQARRNGNAMEIIRMQDMEENQNVWKQGALRADLTRYLPLNNLIPGMLSERGDHVLLNVISHEGAMMDHQYSLMDRQLTDAIGENSMTATAVLLEHGDYLMNRMLQNVSTNQLGYTDDVPSSYLADKERDASLDLDVREQQKESAAKQKESPEKQEPQREAPKKETGAMTK